MATGELLLHDTSRPYDSQVALDAGAGNGDNTVRMLLLHWP
ncbi:hypothetical protein ABZ848_48475 [Streptomyces sp. NPDC047081]